MKNKQNAVARGLSLPYAYSEAVDQRIRTLPKDVRTFSSYIQGLVRQDLQNAQLGPFAPIPEGTEKHPHDSGSASNDHPLKPTRRRYHKRNDQPTTTLYPTFTFRADSMVAAIAEAIREETGQSVSEVMHEAVRTAFPKVRLELERQALLAEKAALEDRLRQNEALHAQVHSQDPFPNGDGTACKSENGVASAMNFSSHGAPP